MQTLFPFNDIIIIHVRAYLEKPVNYVDHFPLHGVGISAAECYPIAPHGPWKHFGKMVQGTHAD